MAVIPRRKRADFWRDVIDSLNHALIVVSPAMEPVALNPAAQTLFGVSQSAFSSLLAANEWLRIMLSACLETGKSVGDNWEELHTERGIIRVRAEVSTLLDSAGRPRGAVVLLRDLTHQGSVEQGFEADAAGLGLSPAGLAHEVKNPLTGIKGAAELIAGMYTAARVQQYCNVILEGVGRITSLVEQVLAVSGPQRLKHEPVNIHRVLHQALKMAGLYPDPQPGIRLEQIFDPSLPEISGDTGMLERVFLNLIRNAAEAIGTSGSIRLVTRMETDFKMETGGKRRRFLRVEVSDSGTGIGSADLQQLFTPFFTTKPKGTGLGLVLSRRIIALHGGKLWAEKGGLPASAPARPDADPAASPPETSAASGMTFKVTLPVVDERGGDDPVDGPQP